MENIDFVLWTILWPLMVKLDVYLTAKTNEIKQQSQSETRPDENGWLVIWVIIALILAFN